VIVFACAILGFTQEYRAERALEALKRMLAPTITVLRDGREKEIPSRELVPGDIVLLEAGDRIPADGRLLEVASLQVDEAPLTGESTPVSKELTVLPESTIVADRKNMVFSGTTVTYGKGRFVVTATGMNTEFGKIAKEVTAVVEEETPLERRMKEVGRWLGMICLAVCFSVAGIGLVREFLTVGFLRLDFLLKMVLFGVALAVAAVPEALPAIVTGALAIGMREMAKRNALVRRMPSVETLGCTSIICVDKTGTLTKGEMTVRRIYVDKKIINVTGVGYEPRGELLASGGSVNVREGALPLLLKGALLCNDAKLEREGDRWYVRGDPTEGALVVAAMKAGLQQDKVREQYPRIRELPFSSERKRMTTVHVTPEGRRVAFMKGAPETVLARCTHIYEEGEVKELSASRKTEVLKVNEEMAKDALRVLAVAYREVPGTLELTEENLEDGLVFLGLMGMMDPPREDAIEAVKMCKGVKIKPVMITGDHKLTAVAVAKEMGIYEEGDLVLTGEELERMPDDEFEKIVDKVTVYARVSPLHKQKIVRAWKRRGQVVAMTGDGVNDAPALKHADIGVAMGITGTEVTKEASDMVLADDNFATIVKAVERGRWIFDNIRKYLTYLLQCSIVEIIVLGGIVLALGPEFLPLLPVQILYINLATDGLPAIALGIAPPDPDIMQRPPRDPKEGVFTKEVISFILLTMMVQTPLLLWLFLTSLPEGLAVARTRLFLAFVFLELAVALNCRSLRYSIYEARPHKWLVLAVCWETLLLTALIQFAPIRDAFGITYPSLYDIGVVAMICLITFISIEFLKSFYIKRRKAH
jgi:Ca2+-transporting ATPase